MTKYISFKIFDSDDYDDWIAIKEKQLNRFYTVVHEDYFEKIIKSGLSRKKVKKHD